MNFLDAFKALDALNEDTYSLDSEGIKKLKEFQDTDDLTDEVTVIDVDAETEEDLSDSYVGKIILDCSVCHSKLYKDKTEITVDEEQQLANVGEECPYCYTSDGFKVIGEVSPFNNESTENNETDTEEVIEDDVTETEVTEDLNESLLTEGKIKDNLKKLATRLGADGATVVRSFAELISDILPEKAGDALYDAAEYVENKAVLKALLSGNEKVLNTCTVEDIEELKQDIEAYKEDRANNKDADLDEATALAERPGTIAHALKDSMDELATISNTAEMKQKVIDIVKDSDVSDKEKSRAIAIFMKPKSATALLSTIGTFMTGIKTESLTESMRSDRMRLNAEILDVLGMDGYDVDDEDVISLADAATELAFEEYLATPDKSLEQIAKDWLIATKENYPEDLAGLAKFNEAVNESLTEDVNNVNVETDDSIVNVSTDETGKVTVTTEPKTEESDDIQSDETIVPVSDETETEIMNNNNDSEEVTDDEVEVDIEEFDEESFDELGESYFKKIYENVNSFKTSSVKKIDDSLIVEGILTIEDKSKKTSFIFESKDTNKSGRVRFIGENKELTAGYKAFTLRGKVQDNKFICESLNYNYKVEDEGTNRRVYGIVTRKD